jgi:transcriptional regulator with XRE-family HTH domain
MRYRARTSVMWQLMKQRGESTRTLAGQVGCSHVMVWSLLNGRKSCGERLATALAAALDVTLDHLFFTQATK